MQVAKWGVDMFIHQKITNNFSNMIAWAIHLAWSGSLEGGWPWRPYSTFSLWWTCTLQNNNLVRKMG